ncbi:Endonuclease/exonuclease/phosphatase [Earliella scabrosa]|nr:Endonuclease/exonuclease/phosphatase [Earliella scabrosa]
MRGYGGGGQGSGAQDKWLCINQVMREKKIAILAIQETHMTTARIEGLNELFKASILVCGSPDPTNGTGARGVAFVLSKKLVDVERAILKEIVPGRAAMLEVPWAHGKTLRVLNVYAPNVPEENATFWTALREAEGFGGAQKPDVVLGDFNVVEASVDRLPPRRDPDDAVDALRNFLARLAVDDGWRRDHEREKGFTYLQKSTGSQSRIDRIYLSREVARLAGDWEVEGPGFETDHQLVCVAIENLAAPFMGPGRWMIPPTLLEDTKFHATLKDLGTRLLGDLNNIHARTEQENPQRVYSQFKVELLKAARKRAKAKIPRLDRMIAGLREDLRATLQEVGLEEGDKRLHAAIIQDKITALEVKRFGKHRQAVAANDFVKGETICKYWTRMNKIPLPSTWQWTTTTDYRTTRS